MQYANALVLHVSRGGRPAMAARKLSGLAAPPPLSALSGASQATFRLPAAQLRPEPAMPVVKHTHKRHSILARQAKANEFHFENGQNDTAYRQQGSNSWDTGDLLRARQALQDSALLRKAAMQFWEALGKAEFERLTFPEYAFVHRRISKALAPELSDDEARQAAQEDWEEDSGSPAPTGSLSVDRYTQGLIEIADMWTDEVNELEYLFFINKLFHRVTIVPRTGGAAADQTAGGEDVSALASATRVALGSHSGAPSYLIKAGAEERRASIGGRSQQLQGASGVNRRRNALKPVAVKSKRIYLPLKDIKDLNELVPRSQEVAAGGNSAAGTSSRANAGKNLIGKHRHELLLIAKSTTPSLDVKLGHRWADSTEFMSKFAISWHLVGDDVGLTQRLHAHVAQFELKANESLSPDLRWADIEEDDEDDELGEAPPPPLSVFSHMSVLKASSANLVDSGRSGAGPPQLLAQDSVTMKRRQSAAVARARREGRVDAEGRIHDYAIAAEEADESRESREQRAGSRMKYGSKRISYSLKRRTADGWVDDNGDDDDDDVALLDQRRSLRLAMARKMREQPHNQSNRRILSVVDGRLVAHNEQDGDGGAAAAKRVSAAVWPTRMSMVRSALGGDNGSGGADADARADDSSDSDEEVDMKLVASSKAASAQYSQRVQELLAKESAHERDERAKQRTGPSHPRRGSIAGRPGPLEAAAPHKRASTSMGLAGAPDGHASLRGAAAGGVAGPIPSKRLSTRTGAGASLGGTGSASSVSNGPSRLGMMRNGLGGGGGLNPRSSVSSSASVPALPRIRTDGLHDARQVLAPMVPRSSPSPALAMGGGAAASRLDAAQRLALASEDADMAALMLKKANRNINGNARMVTSRGGAGRGFL